jgi:hypothetical protein
MLKEIFCLVVLGELFEKQTIEFDKPPTKEEILKAIKELDGKTARVEKRYKIIEE